MYSQCNAIRLYSPWQYSIATEHTICTYCVYGRGECTTEYNVNSFSTYLHGKFNYGTIPFWDHTCTLTYPLTPPPPPTHTHTHTLMCFTYHPEIQSSLPHLQTWWDVDTQCNITIASHIYTIVRTSLRDAWFDRMISWYDISWCQHFSQTLYAWHIV